LQQAAIKNENMFAVLMEATKYCSLGQLTAAMFEVGGQYRRNMYKAMSLISKLKVEAQRWSLSVEMNFTSSIGTIATVTPPKSQIFALLIVLRIVLCFNRCLINIRCKSITG
jgi:hypothetical protein